MNEAIQDNFQPDPLDDDSTTTGQEEADREAEIENGFFTIDETDEPGTDSAVKDTLDAALDSSLGITGGGSLTGSDKSGIYDRHQAEEEASDVEDRPLDAGSDA